MSSSEATLLDDKLCPSCREPLSYPSGDGCANMTAHNSEEPFYIRVVDEVEHEDGSATYSFDLDEKAERYLAKIGLEVVIFCAAYQLDIQEVFDHIAWLSKSKEFEGDE